MPHTPPENKPQNRIHKVYIEPDVVPALRALAQKLGYIRPTSTNMRGFEAFVFHLLLNNPDPTDWRDTRDQYYKENYPPPTPIGWRTNPSEAERRVYFAIKILYLNEIVPIALRLAQVYGFTTRQKHNRYAYIGTLLEAVGLGNLTPNSLPPNPDPPRYPDRGQWRRKNLPNNEYDWLQIDPTVAKLQRDEILTLPVDSPNFQQSLKAIQNLARD